MPQGDATPIILERFRSKFTRNCDKFSFQSPRPVDLGAVKAEDGVEELSVNDAFGLASCTFGQIRISIFRTGKVILKNVKDVAMAISAAQVVFKMLGIDVEMRVAAEDRSHY